MLSFEKSRNGTSLKDNDKEDFLYTVWFFFFI